MGAMSSSELLNPASIPRTSKATGDCWNPMTSTVTVSWKDGLSVAVSATGSCNSAPCSSDHPELRRSGSAGSKTEAYSSTNVVSPISNAGLPAKITCYASCLRVSWNRRWTVGNRRSSSFVRHLSLSLPLPFFLSLNYLRFILGHE